jgi:hypothetical protein
MPGALSLGLGGKHAPQLRDRLRPALSVKCRKVGSSAAAATAAASGATIASRRAGSTGEAHHWQLLSALVSRNDAVATGTGTGSLLNGANTGARALNGRQRGCMRRSVLVAAWRCGRRACERDAASRIASRLDCRQDCAPR